MYNKDNEVTGGNVMSLTKNDIETLRVLANKYMSYATLPAQSEKIGLWRALNRGKMERPMVCIDQICWNEFPSDDLKCTIADPYWQNLERTLREAIYRWEHFPVDMVMEPRIFINNVVTSTGYGVILDEEIVKTDETNSVVSHKFHNLFQEEEDLEKIKTMQFTVDRKLSAEHFQQAQQIFDGIAPVLQVTDNSFHLGVWDAVSHFMGVENVYYDLIDRPEFLHAIVRKLTDSALAGIKQCNEEKLHADHLNMCHCNYIYTDEMLPAPKTEITGLSKDSWAYGLAQLFSSCSPDITEEFELPYVTEMAKQFGAVYYGCCEKLDDRLEIVKKIPNVRKISCSPWSDKNNFASQIGDKIVMSNKPNPAFVAGDIFDEEHIRKDLQETYDIAKANGVNLELILKDISTVNYDPQRLDKWAKIAMEVVQG